MGKIKVLVGCQNEDCAVEVSYHLDMVRLHNDEPICEHCYDDWIERTEDEYENRRDWCRLQPVTMGHLSP